jgi:hypothetical protein
MVFEICKKVSLVLWRRDYPHGKWWEVVDIRLERIKQIG